jgi:hypothetical protein
MKIKQGNVCMGLGVILPAGYAVAYPAMYWAMKREQKKGLMQ